MRPLVMLEDPPLIRRWCKTCDRFTRSRMSSWGSDELCAEHEQPDDDGVLDFIDDWGDEDDDED